MVNWYIGYYSRLSIERDGSTPVFTAICGYSLKVELRLAKAIVWVQFPLLTPYGSIVSTGKIMVSKTIVLSSNLSAPAISYFSKHTRFIGEVRNRLCTENLVHLCRCFSWRESGLQNH